MIVEFVKVEMDAAVMQGQTMNAGRFSRSKACL